jgi:hypothetical protein
MNPPPLKPGQHQLKEETTKCFHIHRQLLFSGAKTANITLRQRTMSGDLQQKQMQSGRHTRLEPLISAHPAQPTDESQENTELPVSGTSIGLIKTLVPGSTPAPGTAKLNSGDTTTPNQKKEAIMSLRTWSFKVNGDQNIGPREISVKAKKDNAKSMVRIIGLIAGDIRRHRRELYGIIGESEKSSDFFSPFGPVAEIADEEQFKKDQEKFFADLPEIITLEAWPGIQQAAFDIYERHVPVEDNRKTPEQNAEDMRKLKERQDAAATQREAEEKKAQEAAVSHDNTDPGLAEDNPQIDIRANEEKNGIEIRFAEKPSPGILSILKEARFRWHRKRKFWYARQSDTTWAVANDLAERYQTTVKAAEAA